MNAMELAHLQIEDLVPHRDRMLLIGEVLEVNTIQARTVSSVNANWPLTGPEGAEPLICVELAAQTAGVCNGWDRIKNRGLDSEQMGWLVAVKRAEFFVDFLPLGSSIEASAKNTLVFDKFREVESQLHQDGQLVASVVLQLFQA
nr:hypothetical protein [uncultured Desulfobulbus sp.]